MRKRLDEYIAQFGGEPALLPVAEAAIAGIASPYEPLMPKRTLHRVLLAGFGWCSRDELVDAMLARRLEGPLCSGRRAIIDGAMQRLSGYVHNAIATERTVRAISNDGARPRSNPDPVSVPEHVPFVLLHSLHRD